MDDPHTFIDDFLAIFGKNGKIIHKLEEKQEKIIREGGFTTWSLKYGVATVSCVTMAYLVSKQMANYNNNPQSTTPK